MVTVCFVRAERGRVYDFRRKCWYGGSRGRCELAIAKTALLQVANGVYASPGAFPMRDFGTVSDTPTFCVKKWYNSSFTIHQFDNT